MLDPRSASLDMRVETQGAGLRLSWNRLSPAAAAAQSGMLEIDDGGQHHEFTLDRNQIVYGSIVYRPASDDVSFRLNLHGSRGPDVAQVLRVLDASPRVAPLVAVTSEEAPAKIARRETTREASQTRAMPVVASIPSAQAPTRPAERSTPAPVQAASVPPPAVLTPAQSAHVQSAQPMPDGETALPNSAQPQIRQSLPVTQPAPASAEKPQPQPAAASEPNIAPEIAPAKPVPAYVPPRPIKWFQPDRQTLGASDPLVPVDIRVKVKIDETGRVTAAHSLIDGGKRDKKLMAAAAAAARQWVFAPAKSHGTNVATEEIIVVHLGPDAQ